MNLSPLVMLLTLGWFGPVSSQEGCSPTTLSTNSYVIAGHVVLADRTKNRSGVEIEVFWLDADVWTLIGKIHTLSEGAFAWLAERRRQFKFVASKAGYTANAVIVNVKNLRESHPEIILPLSQTGCPKAKYR